MEQMAIAHTTVWVDFFGGIVNAQTIWLRGALGSRPVGLVGLVLCEVLQGIRDEAMFVPGTRYSCDSLNLFGR